MRKSTLIACIGFVFGTTLYPELSKAAVNTQYSAAEHAEIKAELGRLYRSLEQYDTALDYFHAASELDPQALYYLEQGWTHYLNQNHAAAQQAYAKAQALLPAQASPHLLRRLSYAQKLVQNLPEAARELELLLLERQDPDDLLQLGQIYQLQQRQESARMAYLKAYAAYNKAQRRTPVELAFGLKASGERYVSRQLFQDLWQRSPRGEYALALAALTYAESPDRSREWLLQLERYRLSQASDIVEQAYLWLQLGDAERSEALYRHVLQRLREEAQIPVLLGATQALLERERPEAYALLQRLAARQKDLTPPQRAAVAYGLMQFQQWQAAQLLFNGLPQPNFEQRLLLAQTHTELGDFDTAASLYAELGQIALQQTRPIVQLRALMAGLLRSGLKERQYLWPVAQALGQHLQGHEAMTVADQLVLAQLLIQTEERQQAEQLLLRLKPDLPAALRIRWVRLLLDLGHWQEAEAALAQVEGLSGSERIELFVLQGQSLLRTQQNRVARRTFLNAESLRQKQNIVLSSNLLSSLALGLWQSEADTTQIQAEIVQRLNSETTLNPRLRLTLLRIQRDRFEALAQLERLRPALKPLHDPEIQALWAATEMDLQQYQEAKALYLALMQGYPQKRDYQREYAAAALLNRDWQLAYEQYRVLLQRDQDMLARFNLALLEKQAGRRQQALALLAPLRNLAAEHPGTSWKKRSDAVVQDMFQSRLGLTPEWDLESFSTWRNAYMIFKGQRIHMAQAQTQVEGIWHTPQLENLAQPDVQTRWRLQLQDFSELEPGVWEPFRQLKTGFSFHYQNLARFPVERLYFTPEVDYVVTQPQLSPVLQHLELKAAAGIVPQHDWGLELRGQVNVGQQNLLLGSFLNSALETQLTHYAQSFNLGYTTGVHSYAIFDTAARRQDVFRWRNTLSGNWQSEQLYYRGEADVSPVWGSINDLNLNALQVLRYPLGKAIYLQAEAEAHHYFNPVQRQQSNAHVALGARWRLPLPESLPLYLGADLRGSWFYQLDNQGLLPGLHFSLRSAL